MKKRIFALGMSMAAAAALATSVSAATLPDQEFEGWWTAHSDGIELSSETTTITFHDVNKGDANWNNAIFVLYNGNEGKVNGDDYAEVAVYRLDSYGWSVDQGDTGDNLATMESFGFTWEARNADCNWDTFVADTQSGVDVTVEVTNTSMTVKSSNGIDYTATFPSAKYISLGGEKSAMSNVSYETGSASGDDNTGDNNTTDNNTTDNNTTDNNTTDNNTTDNNTTDNNTSNNNSTDGNTAGGNDASGNTSTGTGDAAATGNTATGSSAGLALAGLALAGAAVVVSKRK